MYHVDDVLLLFDSVIVCCCCCRPRIAALDEFALASIPGATIVSSMAVLFGSFPSWCPWSYCIHGCHVWHAETFILYFRKIAKSIGIAHRCFQCMIAHPSIVSFGIGFGQVMAPAAAHISLVKCLPRNCIHISHPPRVMHFLVGMTLQFASLVVDKFSGVVLVLCNL